MQLQDIVSWTAIGWIIAVLLGVWGVMIGIGRYTFADVLAIIGGLGFLSKLIADLRLTRPFVLIPALTCTIALEVAAYYWTRGLAREAASETAKQRTFQDQLSTVPKLQEQLENLQVAVNTQKAQIDAKQSTIEGLANLILKQSASLSEESINTLTGGDTFCYITLTPALMGTAGMDAIRVGKYPLREVVATIMDQEAFQTEMAKLQLDISTGKLHPMEAMRVASQRSEHKLIIGSFDSPSKFLGGYPLTSGTHKSLDILFSALNGTWLEYFRLRRVNEKWVKAIQISGDRERHFEKIDDEYPRENGQPVDLPHRVTSASPRDGGKTEPKE